MRTEPLACTCSPSDDPDCPKHGPHTLRDLRDIHRFTQHAYGDGWTEPREVGIGCACGVSYHEHIQHAGECTDRCDWPDDVEDLHAEHILAMAVRARLARSRGALR